MTTLSYKLLCTTIENANKGFFKNLKLQMMEQLNNCKTISMLIYPPHDTKHSKAQLNTHKDLCAKVGMHAYNANKQNSHQAYNQRL